MNMIDVLIIEDDPLSRQALEDLVDHHKQLRLSAAFSNMTDALRYVERNDVDLILLDIGLPDADGFEFLRRSTVRAEVVVVSGDDSHALSAFEYDVVQYLVKPVDTESFNHMVERVKMRIASRGVAAINNHIYIKGDKGFVRIDYDNLLYVESRKDYALFHTPEERHIVRGTMKDIQQSLSNNAQFFRCHRSYIVNLNHVSGFNAGSLVIAEREIPLSSANYGALQRSLNVL